MNQVSVVTLDAPGDQPAVGHPPDDQQLVTAARQGDDRAFEQLYARYCGRIQAFALRMVRDPERAEDLTQDVFISALRRLRETEAEIAFRPWIYEIARNACIDEYRRRRRATEVPLEHDGVDSWLDHLSAGPSPEAAVESKQELEDLRRAFRGLSQRHHRILVARELEGKSYREIGAELGMSQVVVESTLFRARRRLSEEFQELATGRRCQRVQTILGSGSARRVGIRDRRAVLTHIEHCRPCRREALAAGFQQARPLQRIAAAFVPFPLLGLLRRLAAAPAQRAIASAASVARIGQSLRPTGSGGLTAAAAVVAAGVGGGLLAQGGAGPAQAAAAGAGAPAPAAAVSESPRRASFSLQQFDRKAHTGRVEHQRALERAKPARRPPDARPPSADGSGPASGAGTAGTAPTGVVKPGGHAISGPVSSLAPPAPGSLVARVAGAVTPVARTAAAGSVGRTVSATGQEAVGTADGAVSSVTHLATGGLTGQSHGGL